MFSWHHTAFYLCINIQRIYLYVHAVIDMLLTLVKASWTACCRTFWQAELEAICARDSQRDFLSVMVPLGTPIQPEPSQWTKTDYPCSRLAAQLTGKTDIVRKELIRSLISTLIY